MLFKNKEPKALIFSQKMEKELMAVIGKWPVTITYVPELVKPSTNKKNRVPDQPSVVPVLCSWPVNDDGESCVMTYAENFQFNTISKQNEFSPDAIMISGSKTYYEKDKELVWFLWKCFPGFRGGKNNTSRNKDLIMFHLPQKTRFQMVEYEKKLFEAKKLIMDPKEGMLLSQLKDVAKAFFVPDVDEMENVADVQASLLNLLEGGKTQQQKLEIIERFMSIASSEDSIRVRSVIQKAMEDNLIAWDGIKSKWSRVGPDGKPTEFPIMTIPLNNKRDPKEILYEMCAGSQEGRDLIDLLEETQNTKTSK